MPWSEAQMRAIRAKEHGWDPPGKQPFEGVSKRKLKKMSHEGIRTKPTARDAAQALSGRR
jgi:hypothetical protein